MSEPEATRQPPEDRSEPAPEPAPRPAMKPLALKITIKPAAGAAPAPAPAQATSQAVVTTSPRTSAPDPILAAALESLKAAPPAAPATVAAATVTVGATRVRACAYCKDGLEEWQTVELCPRCQVPLHTACRRELTACPTIGCQGLDGPAPGRPAVTPPAPLLHEGHALPSVLLFALGGALLGGGAVRLSSPVLGGWGLAIGALLGAFASAPGGLAFGMVMDALGTRRDPVPGAGLRVALVGLLGAAGFAGLGLVVGVTASLAAGLVGLALALLVALRLWGWPLGWPRL